MILFPFESLHTYNVSRKNQKCFNLNDILHIIILQLKINYQIIFPFKPTVTVASINNEVKVKTVSGQVIQATTACPSLCCIIISSGWDAISTPTIKSHQNPFVHLHGRRHCSVRVKHLAQEQNAHRDPNH